MNNADLAVALSAKHGVTQKLAKEYVDTIVSNISDALIRGDEVSLKDFGKFKVADKPSRLGRNPATGEQITIAASKKASFTPSKAFKEALKA